MRCPVCGLPLNRGRWVIVRVLEYPGTPTGYRARWEPSQDLLCPDEHGRFELDAKS